MSELCHLYCENHRHVDLCAVQHLSTPVTGNPLLGKQSALWKLAPMADPLVYEFHSRDLVSTTVTAVVSDLYLKYLGFGQ